MIRNDGSSAPRIGVIGCGVHARSVLLPALQMAGAHVVAVCDVDSKRSATLGMQLGVPWYMDATTLMDSNPIDGVVVAASPPAHQLLIALMTARGVPTLIEKPAGLDADDIASSASLAAAKGCQVQVGFMRRFAPSYRIARQIGAKLKGSRAVVLRVSAGGGGSFDPWLRDVGVHYFDLCRFLLGDVKEASGGIIGTDTDGYIAQVSLTCAHGSALLHLSSAGTWGRGGEHLWLEGKGEAVEVSNVVELIHHRRGREEVADDRAAGLPEYASLLWRANFTSPRIMNHSLYLDGYVSEIDSFLKAIQLGVPVRPNLEDALAAMRIAEAVISSSRIKETVGL